MVGIKGKKKEYRGSLMWERLGAQSEYMFKISTAYWSRDVKLTVRYPRDGLQRNRSCWRNNCKGYYHINGT